MSQAAQRIPGRTVVLIVMGFIVFATVALIIVRTVKGRRRAANLPAVSAPAGDGGGRLGR